MGHSQPLASLPQGLEVVPPPYVPLNLSSLLYPDVREALPLLSGPKDTRITCQRMHGGTSKERDGGGCWHPSLADVDKKQDGGKGQLM